MSKGGCYIWRDRGVPRGIMVTVQPAVMKHVGLPRGCSEEEAERVRAEYAKNLAAGNFHVGGVAVVAHHRRRNAPLVPVVTNELPDAPGVYFVQLAMPDGNGPIKIGVSSTSMRTRVADFNSGYPWRVVVLGWAPGGQEEERAAHFAMRAHRMNGEWFKPHPDVFAFVGRCQAGSIEDAAIHEIDRDTKPQGPIFDVKAYEAWVNGEDVECPILQLGAR